jgi:hypothetical protein
MLIDLSRLNINQLHHSHLFQPSVDVIMDSELALFKVNSFFKFLVINNFS